VRRGAGFTLVELLLALGLLSVLLVALVRLLDTSLKIWDRTEVSRDLQEMGGAVLDLVAEDLWSLEAGPRGDLLGDWAKFDVDHDGQLGGLMPRLRFVRQATAVDLLRATPPVSDDEELSPTEVRYGKIDPREKGLLEVCWALLPPSSVGPDERPLGLLFRGERRLEGDTLSFLDPRFFNAVGKPPAGSLDLVTGGVLWLEVVYASQTTVLSDGWKQGEDLSDCSTSWDAWDRGRPDLEVTYLNTTAAGMPEVDELPVLPRRVLVTVELERPADLKRRTRLLSAIAPESNELLVDDERKLPEKDGLILVGEEWMRVLTIGPGYTTVLRAQRGTRADVHEAGAMIHWGHAMQREIPIPTMREDWDL